MCSLYNTMFFMIFIARSGRVHTALQYVRQPCTSCTYMYYTNVCMYIQYKTIQTKNNNKKQNDTTKTKEVA